MVTVKLEESVVKDLRILKAMVGSKTYSELISQLMEVYKEVNSVKG